MKSVKKILSYQKTIIRALSLKNYTFKELEHACLDKIGHIADWSSYIHALEDLACGDRIQKSRIGFSINS